MSYPIMTRGSQETIDSTSIESGKFRLAIDTHRLFLDINSSTRIEITDFIKGFTYDEILAIEDVESDDKNIVNLKKGTTTTNKDESIPVLEKVRQRASVG
jgi:hypothetical protein